MTKEQRRERLESIGLSRSEFRGLSELANETLLRHRAQWNRKDEDEQEAWFFDLGQLVKECGLTRVSAGMRAAWTRIQFLPSAPEVRQYLPPPEAAKPTPMSDPNCAECNGSGWKAVMKYSALYGREERCVKRCDCNTRPHKTRDAVAASTIPHDIKAKIAKLDRALKMPAPPQPRHPAAISTSSPIRGVQLSGDEIQQRRAIELTEIWRVEEQEATA